MERICNHCGAIYSIKPCKANTSKFCSRSCHDKGKTYKAVGDWKRIAVKLRLEERLSIGDIAIRMNLPYRKVAGYVRPYPLTDEERSAIREKKLKIYRSKHWPKTNRALFNALGITSCEYPGCSWTETLEIHHIDGNHDNNDRCNIQVLCPNHHSLTPNYRNKKHT